MYLKKQIPAVVLLFILFCFVLNTSGALVTWTGATNTSWNTASNWSTAATPTAFDTVEFSSNAVNCVVTGTVSMAKLRVLGSYTGTFTIDGATFTVSEDASLSGAPGDTLILNAGTIAYFNVSGTLYANYAAIFNINCSGSQGLAFNSRNDGTNTNWQFMNPGTKIWDGGGVDSSWSTAENWIPDEVPTATDSIVFDNTSFKNCSLDVPTSFKDLMIFSGYTGTFNVNNQTVGISGDCNIENHAGPLFIGDSAIFNFNGGISQTFTARTGYTNPSIHVSNNSSLIVSAGASIPVKSIDILSGSTLNAPAAVELIVKSKFINNGIFVHNSGVVKFDTTSGIFDINIGSSSFHNLSFIGTATYQTSADLIVENDLSISGVTIDLGIGYTHTFNTITSLASTGNLNFNGSTINIGGNVDFSNLNSLQWTDNALVILSGTTPQTIMANNTTPLPSMQISNSSSVSFTSPSSDISIRDLEIDAGATFTALPPGWNLIIKGSFINNGFFNHNSGVVVFDSTNGNHNITSSSPLNHININGAGAIYQFTSNITASQIIMQNGTLDFGSSNIHTIDSITSSVGTSTLNFNNSRVIINGIMLINQVTTIGANSDTLEFNGTGAQQLYAPPAIDIGHILHSGIGTLTLMSTTDVSSFTQTDGILDMNASDLNIQSGGDLTVSRGSINNLDARQILVTGDANLTGMPSDSVFITPAAVGNLNVTGSLNASYAVIGNVNANGSQGVATNSRNAGGNTNWVFPPATMLDVFYSVGTSNLDLKTGSPSITISNDTATISTAQSQNIGAGDKIMYNAGSIVHIAKRVNSSQYIVTTSNGSSPSPAATLPVDGIYRTFSSLSEAFINLSTSMYLNTNDLVAINRRVHLTCYADGPDTIAAALTGYATSAQNNISIYTPGMLEEVGAPQNHHGKWNSSGYMLSVSGSIASGRVLRIQVPHVKIHGLQIEYTGGDVNAIQTISIEADSCDISNNIIRLMEGSPANQRMGIFIGGDYYTRIWNNVVYNFTGGSTSDAGIYTSTGITDVAMPVYNNTVFNCAIGIQSFPNNAILAKNNISYACSSSYANGTYASGSSNNLAGPTLSDAPGSSALQMTSVAFFDEVNGDFRLMHNQPAIDMGINLTSDPVLPIDDDITFFTRGATWDIGAYEYANTIPNQPTLDTMIAGEVIITNTLPVNVNLKFDISDVDTLAWIKYQIQIDDSMDFSTPELDYIDTTFNTSPQNNIVHTASLNAGNFYWRARTIDQYNAQSAWTVANAGGIAFTIDGPDSPTDIILSNNTINENEPANSTIGLFTSTDPDAGATHSYALVAGTGDVDNGSFILIGDTLKSSSTFDFETKSSYSIRIRSTDNSSLSFEKQFTINVTDVAEDTSTQMPMLTSPTDNDTIHNFFDIDFTLPEAALNQTVKMTFMQTGGTSDFNSPHVVRFNAGFQAVGNHFTNLNAKDLNNNTNVDSVSSNPNDFLEHEGVYSVKMEYQDASGNPVSMVIAGNVLFTDTIMPNVAPQITTANYYESNKELHISFDKKIFFVDTTKNFYLSTDNGIKDTVVIQAPWTFSYFDTTMTTVKINVPIADISLLEGLLNKSQLEISLQDSTFGDSLAWTNPIDYSMNIHVGYIENIGILHISSAHYNEITNELMLTFDTSLNFIDTTAELGIYHKNDTSLAFTLSTPWSYGLNSAKDTVKVLIPEADAAYIESWNGVDSSLSLISGKDLFQSGNMFSSAHDKYSFFPVNYKKDQFLFNMFDISLNSFGDTAIEAYLYFINTSHDTGSGVLVNYGFGDITLDSTQTPWAFKDSSFLIPNTTVPGFWNFVWAPVSLNGTIGEISRDSIEIFNIAPEIQMQSSYSIYEDSLFTLTGITSDKNGDVITLGIVNAPTDMIIKQDVQSISWTPNNSDVGNKVMTVIAVDTYGDSSTLAVTLSIENTNDMPVFDTVIIADTIYEDSSYTGIIKAYDIDLNDDIKLFIEPDSSWVSLVTSETDSAGSFKFDISLNPDNSNTGLQVIKYHIKDISGSALAFIDTIFVINTNDAPEIQLLSKTSNLGAVKLSFKGKDDFDTSLSFVTSMSSDNFMTNDTNTTGIFEYYPLEDGTYSLISTVFDKEGLSASYYDTFSIVNSTQKTFVKSSDWNMVSIPSQSYSANNFKTAGTILHWDETKDPNNIYKYYTRESGIANLYAGQSYFIKNGDSTISISIDSGSLIRDTFSITLNSGEFGWNQISSPYVFPVKVDNPDLTFWEYDPSVKEYVDAQGIVMPWKGYWVQVNEAQNLSLKPQPYYAGRRARRSIARHNGKEDWIYTISLSTAISQDRDNFFGFSPEASDSKDRFDRPEAPRMNDVPYLFFKQSEWQGSIDKFASDVRQKRKSEDFFDIGIAGSGSNREPMTVKISGYNKNEDVYLFARTSKGIAPYEPGSEITIGASPRDQYITVIASMKPELTIPLTFKTFSPYPNPCKPIANIRYALPYSWQSNGSMIKDFNVRVAIYDVKGRVVRELINGKQKPGNHRVVWNGKNGNGSTVASGAYFIKIDAGKHRAVKKLMVMR